METLKDSFRWSRAAAHVLALVLSMAFGSLILSAPAGWAQETSLLELRTSFPGLVVDAGSTATFQLTAVGPVGSRGQLDVDGLPDEWEASFQNGSTVVDHVEIVGPDPQELELSIKVPDDAPDGRVDFTAKVGGSPLDLAITVVAGVAGEVTLSPDFVGLRGPVDGDFTFNVTLANDTATPIAVTLSGEGPQGWRVTAEPSGEPQATEVSVDPGDSTRINLKAEPPAGAEAGTYQVSMAATGDGVDVGLTVDVQLIGDFSVDLTTPDQRLNADVTIGQANEFSIVVINDGTAPLTAVNVSSRAPSGWEVSLQPETVNDLEPGESALVTATITPADGALAGDYDLTFTATADNTSDNVSIRTTVSPSPLWGLIGVGLIALTLAGLAFVFRRFGRR